MQFVIIGRDKQGHWQARGPVATHDEALAWAKWLSSAEKDREWFFCKLIALAPRE